MTEQDTLLGHIRVLDLADPKGVYCAKLLADLGADVIKIERPGGDPMRNIGPFFHDEPDSEKSLYWFHFNTSKRGITLNLETASGREVLKKLVKTADVMVETFPPGHLEQMGLGYETLRALNPRLILTSVTPFGQTGPYRDFKGSDMIAQAMGGLMRTGYLDDPPYRIYGSQAHHSASVVATVGTMVALYARELTGEGQQVDVSLQESVCQAMETAMQAWDMKKELRRRIVEEDILPIPGIRVYECKDGYVMSYVVAGAGAGWDVIIDWMDSEGMAGDLRDPKYDELWGVINDFRSFIAMLMDPEALTARLEVLEHVNNIYTAFLANHTKDELYNAAAERRLMIVPVQSPKDLLESPQFAALGYFVDVEHPELGTTIKYPGAPYELPETPWRIHRRAPLIGEHNFEIYEKELGFTREELAILKQEGAI